MNNSLYDSLLKLGFSEKEALVYIASNEVGTAVCSLVAKQCGLNRVTTYDILEKLKERGFVSYVIRSKTKVFTAISPSVLFDLFSSNLSSFSKTISSLKARSVDDKSVEVFEGISAFDVVSKVLLSEKSDLYCFFDASKISLNLQSYYTEFFKNFKRLKFSSHLFVPYSKPNRIFSDGHDDVVFVRPDFFDFETNVFVSGGYVLFISVLANGEPYFVLNRDLSLVSFYKSVFKMARLAFMDLEESLNVKQSLLKPLRVVLEVGGSNNNSDDSNPTLF